MFLQRRSSTSELGAELCESSPEKTGRTYFIEFTPGTYSDQEVMSTSCGCPAMRLLQLSRKTQTRMLKMTSQEAVLSCVKVYTGLGPYRNIHFVSF